MEDNKNQQANNQDAGQNPTLDAPGSQVADYGNPAGGSGNDNVQQGAGGGDNSNNEKSGGRSEGNDTIGTP